MSTNVLMRPIGFVASPYSNTRQIPKGFVAQHDAEGTLEILPEYELGLTDIEGFSNLKTLLLRSVIFNKKENPGS